MKIIVEILLAVILSAIIGGGAGYMARKRTAEAQIGSAEEAAKKIVAEYNKKIGEAEQKIGTSLSKVTISELAELEKRSPLVK